MGEKTNNTAIIHNSISNSTLYGVFLKESSNASLVSNVFQYNNLGGKSQASDISNPAEPNRFFGNYWSDWTRPDKNNDGIVDKPYPISGNTGGIDPQPVTTREDATYSVSQITTPKASPSFTLELCFVAVVTYTLLNVKRKRDTE